MSLAEDIKKALLEMDGALAILLRMASAIYEPTPWAAAAAEGEEEADDERWATREERATVGGWAWKVFGDVAALGPSPHP